MNFVEVYYPKSTAKSMGRLPNDVRTALVKSEAKEMELLANLLLSKKEAYLPYNLASSK